MKKCPKCNLNHSKSGKYCSRSCANSRSWSEKDKLKKSESNKKFAKENPDHHKKLANFNRNRPHKDYSTFCVICDKPFEGRKKTCSRECFSKLASKNALKQERHGWGISGIYKGIRCDSLYELAFLIYHLDNHSDIKRADETKIYFHEGHKRNYKPDFNVNGQIYEIKGWLQKIDESKLFYNKDIILIDKEDIKPYISYVKNVYKVNDIRTLYDSEDDKKYIEKFCPTCKNIFSTTKKHKKYCSNKCQKTYKRTDEIKNKISNSIKELYKSEKNKMGAKKGHTKKKINCPHCNKIGSPNNMTRWHFDNCKFK